MGKNDGDSNGGEAGNGTTGAVNKDDRDDDMDEENGGTGMVWH